MRSCYRDIFWPNNLILGIWDKDSFAYKAGMKEATSKNIRQTLEVLAESIRPEDTFIFYYVGQANIVKDKAGISFDINSIDDIV